MANPYSNMADDAREAAGTAVKAAKTAKKAVKIAANVASQNYVGALKEAVSDGTAGRIITFILLAVFLFGIILFVCLPISIFEGLEGLIDGLKDAWEEAYYASNQTGLIRVLRSFAAVISKVADTLLDGLKSLVFSSETMNYGGRDTDCFGDPDLTLLSSKDDSREVYTRKITAVKDKLDSRMKQCMDAMAVSTQRGGAAYLMALQQYQSRPKTAGGPADEYRYSFGGVAFEGQVIPCTETTALELISLYTCMYDENMDSVKPSALMKWLGFPGGGGETVFFTSYGMDFTMPAWEGEFMPDYLVKEMLARNEEEREIYREHMAPGADLMIRAEVMGLEERESETLNWELRTPDGLPILDLADLLDGNLTLVRIHDITVSYTLSALIYTRNAKDLADEVGLYEEDYGRGNREAG